MASTEWEYDRKYHESLLNHGSETHGGSKRAFNVHDGEIESNLLFSTEAFAQVLKGHQKKTKLWSLCCYGSTGFWLKCSVLTRSALRDNPDLLGPESENNNLVGEHKKCHGS